MCVKFSASSQHISIIYPWFLVFFFFRELNVGLILWILQFATKTFSSWLKSQNSLLLVEENSYPY